MHKIKIISGNNRDLESMVNGWLSKQDTEGIKIIKIDYSSASENSLAKFWIWYYDKELPF